MILPTLQSDRVLLRRPEMRDAPVIQELASDFVVAANTLNIPHPYPDGAAEEFVRRIHQQIIEDNVASFAITDPATDAYMGGIGLHFNKPDNNGEIGYWLGQPYRGQGIMTDVVRLVLRYAFTEHEFNRVYASVFSDNPASRRVLEKCGMTYEGMMRQHVFKWGAYKDILYFAILHDEFEWV